MQHSVQIFAASQTLSDMKADQSQSLKIVSFFMSLVIVDYFHYCSTKKQQIIRIFLQKKRQAPLELIVSDKVVVIVILIEHLLNFLKFQTEEKEFFHYILTHTIYAIGLT